MEHTDHPMISQQEAIEKNGLMLFDNISRMPSYNEPYTTPLMIICLNEQGWVDTECDMRRVRFDEHNLAVLTPHHILCTRASSADYRARLIVMSPAFQEEMKLRYSSIYQENFHYLYQPHIQLNERQFATMQQLFEVIGQVSAHRSARRWDMLGDMLEVLFLLLHDYREENGIGNHQPSYNEHVFSQFYKAVIAHYTESREVQFYADLVHVSPKHFSTLIKQHTGISPHEWICSYVTIQAKSLLRYQQQLSVQEIALQLGFEDQATFSRYFKNATGMSPSEFREQL